MHSIEKYSFDVLYILSLNENNKYWYYLCFFIHHHIACVCSVIIYCKTRAMAKFRCWGLPLNIEYWKQCILTKEFWAWTMIPYCTLFSSLNVSRTFVDFLLLVDQSIVLIKWCYKIPKRNIDKFLWYIFISFIKCMTSIYLLNTFKGFHMYIIPKTPIILDLSSCHIV